MTSSRNGLLPKMMAIAATLALMLASLLPGSVSVAQGESTVDCTDWSSQTLQIMAPAGPGGGWDTTARELQRALQDEGIVDTVEVFNVEGAGGTVGLAELVSEHAGNGHMAMVMGAIMIGGIELNQSPVTLDQTTPIARLTTEFEVIAVSKNSPYQTMDALIEAFRENPGSISWGGGSAGGTDHITVGLIAKAVGVDPTLINYVPFLAGGGDSLAAILGGQVTVGISGLGEWLPQIESGELRALALSGRASASSNATPATAGATPTTSSTAASIPTLKDLGIDVEIANWRGIVAPPDIPEEDAACLASVIESAVKTDAWAQTLQRFGWTDYYAPREEFVPFIEEEREKIVGILRDLQLIEGE